ncbi:FAD synthase [Candidatus Nomurabacteria bacterium CG10_big_fil_rev_8_21_14_0_10_35_16]|uniref:FAD synthase n=1 Tax=Candidatus Nomurabacteria bacterium CG10_big_fil_rev_8_21_14_0_10_35_16 TaxID=1974731 RepID=A0A2H0TB39_9BACT|nr:MAG: FAD synthase [Candidatus Nomurabacteria bacterium CG10_big_fil_rev_8_21_14_0_10_35_16]
MTVKEKQKKIMVFGTFDGLHLGHLNFFKQARRLAPKPFLIVSIARDKNVKIIKKNFPILKEKKRISLVKKSNLVDQVVLAGLNNHLPHILKIRPDIIALGYDQKNYVPNLKKDLQNKGLIVKIIRLRAYKKNIYKNHLLKRERFI